MIPERRAKWTQNLNLEFAEYIATRGHYREITNSKDTKLAFRGVFPIARDEFLDHILAIQIFCV